MAVSVRVEHPDGTTETLTHITSAVSKEFNKQDVLSVVVPRAQAVTLTSNTDEIYLVEDGTDVFGGVLSDINKGGVETELNVDSFERYAREAKPCGTLYTFENASDKTVIEDAISDVSELTSGTIANVKSGLSFQFNHTSPARRMRVVRDATGAEFTYHPDKTVDYVASLGTDKSGSITISPNNQNIAEDFSVEENSGSKKANHLRMLGGGSGDAQTVVEVTASGYDPQTDRAVWTTYANKEIKDSITLREQATELVEELQNDHLEISATIKDETVALGDTLHVKYDAEGIDANLRVVSVKELRDATGLRYDVSLSNRNLSRFKNAEKIAQDVERFNRAQAKETLSTYDDPATAPQEEGNVIYVTGANAAYPQGLYYHDGVDYSNIWKGPVDSKRGHFSESFVVPVGSDKAGSMVLPIGTDKYDT